MTTEEAIKRLKEARFSIQPYQYINEVLDMAIKALEQEPFINKDCVSKSACHEDKIRVLDKITTEMEQLTVAVDTNRNQYVSKNDVINIINKYMTERNDKE